MSMRPFYEKSLERIKRDINDLLGSPEPQHKALMEAFKAAEMCTDALSKLKDDTDPLAKLTKEDQEKIDAILARYV